MPPTTDPQVEAVLPLTERDFARARLLFATLGRVRHPIARLQVVVPDAAARSRFESGIEAVPIRSVQVRTESDVFGGWRGGWSPSSQLGRWTRRGWYRQQMIKLAVAAERSEGHLLTLDADVLLLRDIEPGEWFEGERASCVVLDTMRHPHWYGAAAWLLGTRPLTREIGVTPALLHRPTCAGLLERLQRGGGDWRHRLAWAWGWSEYALYATWARHTGALERYHRPVAYDDWFGPSVWHRRDWPGWPGHRHGERRIAPADAAGRGPFAVVQSHLGLDPHQVAKRLGLDA